MTKRTICAEDDCSGVVIARGWCRNHYYKWVRDGKPNTGRPLSRPIPLVRLMAKVDQNGPDGCWIFAPLNPNGYGHFWYQGRFHASHRVAYLLFRGPIPDGLVLDHLCRRPACVNPWHLEAVTQRENLLRADTFQARNAAKTHCDHGHAFDTVNTCISFDGSRRCRMCARESTRRSRARKPA